MKIITPSLVSVRSLAAVLLKKKPSRPIHVLEAIIGGNNSAESREDYLNGHIPGAVCFDIDECSDKSNRFPHMLPDEKLFAEYVQHLGITNDSHVIAYENNGEFGVYRSPRLWWMFRCFGHDTTSVLNGGFSEWLRAGLPVETGDKQVIIKTNQPFTAKLNKYLVRDYETMVTNVQSGGSMYQVVDARGKARFDGEGEFRPGISTGHIPYALNVPFVECLDKESQLMKDPERLKQVFVERGVDLDRPITTTCGSGITASVLALAAHECGRRDVGVYDGSWAEWGRRAPPDMVEKN